MRLATTDLQAFPLTPVQSAEKQYDYKATPFSLVCTKQWYSLDKVRIIMLNKRELNKEYSCGFNAIDESETRSRSLMRLCNNVIEPNRAPLSFEVSFIVRTTILLYVLYMIVFGGFRHFYYGQALDHSSNC